MKIAVISLWEPWASAMGRGKSNETRHWAAPKSLIGQRIAIHAAKRPLDSIAKELIFSGIGANVAAKIPGLCQSRGPWNLNAFPFGCVVSHGILSACLKVTEEERVHSWRGPDAAIHRVILPPTDPVEAAFGNYEPDRFAWVFDDIRHLETPIPLRGQQGIWYTDLPIEVTP